MGLLNSLVFFMRRNWLVFTFLFGGAVALGQTYYDQINVDNLRLDGNTISSQNTNGDINLDPNGSGGVAFPDLTASTVPYLDSNKELTSSSVTPTELGYLSGVTSAIQTQLDSKASTTLTDSYIYVGNGSNVATGVAVSGDIGLANDGTVSISSGVITNADVNASAGIEMSKLEALTASRVPVLDGSGFLSASSVTSTTLGYLDATSSIQTQLDAKIDDFSGTTDNVLLRTNGTGGDAIQESGISVDDSDVVSGATQINIITQGELRLQDTTGGQYMGFRAPGTVTSSQTFTLPDGDGTNGQILKTNGSGILAWGDDNSGGVPSVTVESKTADFSASYGYVYLVDTSLGDVTASVDTASGNSGKSVTFKVTDSTNDLVIDPNSTETVEGSTLFYGGGSSTYGFTSDGSNLRLTNNGPYEYTEVVLSSNSVTVTANTFVDATGASLVLIPGTWDVGYSVPALFDYVTGSANCGVRITDSSNNLVAGSESYIYATTTADVGSQVSSRGEVIVTSQDTYKIRVVCDQNAAVARMFLDVTSTYGNGVFWARRMK